MTPERMWQNSKISPLIERVSPGVASQTPVLIVSPRAASWAQVLYVGSPEIRRSGSGPDSWAAKEGSVSMVFRSGMLFLYWFGERRKSGLEISVWTPARSAG